MTESRLERQDCCGQRITAAEPERFKREAGIALTGGRNLLRQSSIANGRGQSAWLARRKRDGSRSH